MHNYSKYKVLLIIFAIIILSVFLYPSSVKALTLTPVRFEISGNPGDVLTEEITLTNEGESPETYFVSYSNFEAQGENGDPAFVEPKEGLGTWINTPYSSVVILERQQRVIPFTITIPKDAVPGGYFSVIFWGSSPSGGSGVSVGAKTGILVLLSVNGDVKEDAGLFDFNTKNKQFWYSTLPVSFEYRLKNDGGDRIKPQGKITIRDTIFLPAEYLDANKTGGNVLPVSTRKFNVDWIKYERPKDYTPPSNLVTKFFSDAYYQWRNFAVGLYSANLNVAYGKEGIHSKSTTFFFVFPWQLVLVMLLIFIIIFWGGKKLIKRYNKFIIDKARVGMHLPPTSSNV